MRSAANCTADSAPLAGHLTSLGAGLERAVQSYNHTVRSLEIPGAGDGPHDSPIWA